MFHPKSNPNNTNQTDCLNRQLKVPSPTSSTSQGITEDSSTNSPTMHEPYMFHDSNGNPVCFLTLKEMPDPTKTSPNRKNANEQQNNPQLRDQTTQLQGNKTTTPDHYRQTGRCSAPDAQMAAQMARHLAPLPEVPRPGILPTPTSSPPTPDQRSPNKPPMPQFDRFLQHKTIEQRQQANLLPVPVNASKKPWQKINESKALKILQQHYLQGLSHAPGVTPPNQPATTWSNTKNRYNKQ